MQISPSEKIDSLILQNLGSIMLRAAKLQK